MAGVRPHTADSGAEITAEERGNGQGTTVPRGAAPRVGAPLKPRWWRDVLRRRMLAVADAGAGAVAGVVLITSSAELPWAIAPVPVWILVAKLLGLYDRDHRALRHLTIDEIPGVGVWAAVVVFGLAMFLPLTPAGSPTTGAVVGGWLIAAVTALLLRGVMRWLWRRLTPPERTVVLGNGQLAQAVCRKVQLFGDMHQTVIATIDTIGSSNGQTPIADSHGKIQAFEQLAPTVDRMIVASSHTDPDAIGRLVVSCRRHQIKLSVISPLRGRARPVPRISHVADLPILEYNTWDVSRSTVLLKRVFDVAVSVAGLLLLIPLFPLVALAIKLDSRGPVLFTQLRAGLDGCPFRLRKLRTMKKDAEGDLAMLVSLDALKEPVFKLCPDPRVTRIGRVLRRLSLDELPQLWNVLRGEMSIVGPRPEQMELVERYLPEHRFRLDVKPGITGPMQVFGRGELDFQERLAVELDYVENLSLARDIQILLHTLPAIARGTGAY